MKSIPTIFCRDKATRLLIDRPLQMVKWVFEGKGTATRKFDGVAIKVEHGKVYRRWEWTGGRNAGLMPVGFQKLQDFDPQRPNAPIPGWVPVPSTFLTHPKNTDERCLKEAWEAAMATIMELAKAEAMKVYASTSTWVTPPPVVARIPDGTYELCGPKIHGNNEKLTTHHLIPHGSEVVKKVPRKFEELKKFLETYEGEGIVWHYKVDGGVLMAKIKRSDFGFTKRYVKPVEPPKAVEPTANGLTPEEQKEADGIAHRLAEAMLDFKPEEQKPNDTTGSTETLG